MIRTTWARPGPLVLLALTAVLYTWDLAASGYANSFYATAVQSTSTGGVLDHGPVGADLRLQQLDPAAEVGAVSGIQQGVAQNGKSVVVQAGDPSTVFKIMKVDVRHGSTSALDADSIGLYSFVANDHHWTIGSAGWSPRRRVLRLGPRTRVARSLIIIVLLAALAGAVAAVLPSRRAAKLNVPRAVASN